MEITLLQIVLVFIVACIAGMESVLDEFQFHRPLIACTLIGAVLGDMKTGIIIGGTLEMIALGWMNIGAAVALMPRWRPLFPPSWLLPAIRVSAPVSRWLSRWRRQARC